MVAIRFEWPYGGHHVFVSGSFTGWSVHQPMTLVDGSSTVFEAICNLAPGIHQYKFFVDGIWRHVEHQPCVTDEYGVVNNFILIREPEIANMDVDNGVIQRAASFADGMHREPIVMIAAAEIEGSRRQISIHLSRYTAYDLLPESGKVVILDVKLPVKQAFYIMYEQGLAVVPLWDACQGQFVGMLSASDFILILRELHNNGPMLTNEELDMHTISAWKEGKSQLNREADGPVQLFRRPLIQAGPHESLEDVARRILQNKISTVPIIHSSMQDGSCPQLLHLACLSGILKHICRHLNSSGLVPLLQQPICRFPLGTWVPGIGRAIGRQLTVLRPNATLSSALNILMEVQVSSIPIVDENGSLLDVYSRSDITALARGGVYARTRLDQTNMHQALQLGYEANGPINGRRQCHTCLRSDSLHEIMERLSDPAVRRLVVIEVGTKRVEGIISLRDIFNFFLPL